MFVWECIKNDGKHLGTCTDGFLYGSCCGKPEKGTEKCLSVSTKLFFVSIIHVEERNS